MLWQNKKLTTLFIQAITITIHYYCSLYFNWDPLKNEVIHLKGLFLIKNFHTLPWNYFFSSWSKNYARESCLLKILECDYFPPAKENTLLCTLTKLKSHTVITVFHIFFIFIQQQESICHLGSVFQKCKKNNIKITIKLKR